MSRLIQEEASPEEDSPLSSVYQSSLPSPIIASPPAKRGKFAWIYHFYRPDPKKDKFFFCRFASCSTKPSFNGESTSNLHSHFAKIHGPAWTQVAQLGTKTPDQAFANQLIADERRGQLSIENLWSPLRKQDSERRIHLLSWLILDGLPFRTTESANFRAFTAAVGGWQSPSLKTLMRLLPPLTRAINLKIDRNLARLDFVSVAFDEWSSATLDSYLSIVYQGFDPDLNLVTAEDLVAFQPPHTAAHYTQTIRDRLNRRTTDKVTLVSMTTDGGSAGRKAAAELTDNSRDWLWCMAHLLQLAVHDVIGKEMAVAQDIAHVREWVRQLRSHLVLRSQLKEAQTLLELDETQVLLDVETRWDSILTMISSFLRAWPAIVELAAGKSLDPFIPSALAIDVAAIRRLTAAQTVLGEIQKLTTLLGTASFPPLVFSTQWLIQVFDYFNSPADSQSISELQKPLRAALLRRFREALASPSLTLVTSLFDPQFHDGHHLVPVLGATETAAAIARADARLAEEILATNQPRRLPWGGQSPAITIEAARGFVSAYHKLCSDNHAEIELLFRSATGPESRFGILKAWWLANRDVSPQLFRTARAFLAIPATSTSCERMFSLSGHQFSVCRRSLHTTTLEEILTVQCNVGGSAELVQLFKQLVEETPNILEDDEDEPV